MDDLHQPIGFRSQVSGFSCTCPRVQTRSQFAEPPIFGMQGYSPCPPEAFFFWPWRRAESPLSGPSPLSFDKLSMSGGRGLSASDQNLIVASMPNCWRGATTPK